MSKTDRTFPLKGTSFRLGAAVVALMVALLACAQPGATGQPTQVPTAPATPTQSAPTPEVSGDDDDDSPEPSA